MGSLFLRLLMLLLFLKKIEAMTLWAITRTWPVPMPIHSNSSILPAFFSTNCDMDIPCGQPLGEESQPYSATNFSLASTLCFKPFKKNSSSPCIYLKRVTLGHWLDPLRSFPHQMTNMLTEALSKVAAGATGGSGTGSQGGDTTAVTTLLLTSNLTIPIKAPDTPCLGDS